MSFALRSLRHPTRGRRIIAIREYREVPMTTAKRTSDVEEKIDQLEGAVHDVLEGAKESIAQAEGSMEKAKEALGEGYGKLRSRSAEAYDKAKEQFDKLAAEIKKGYAKVKAKVQEIDVKEVRDDVVDYVRRNPGKSILIALGVGFAVGYLVRRRES